MKRLAIVGGGIAGVSAAYFLQPYFEVSLFEKKSYFGGNNCSSDLLNHQVQLPMAVIVFPSETVFSKTHQLIKELNLELTNKVMSHSIYIDDKAVHRAGISHFFSSLDFNSIKDYRYLFFQFKKELFSEKETVLDLIESQKLSARAVWHFLIPVASLYLSMPYQQTSQLPLTILFKWWEKYCYPFYQNARYSYIKGGNHLLIDALLKQSNCQTYLQHQVNKVERSDKGIKLLVEEQVRLFDYVVMATEPSSALSLLSPLLAHEKAILENIETRQIKSVVHQNNRYIDGDNLTIKVNHRGDDFDMVTTWGANGYFNMGLKQEYYTSIMSKEMEAVNDDEILRQEIMTVPLPSLKTLSAIESIHCLNNNRLNTYFCGAYFSPFFYHEDAIQSAFNLVQQMRHL